VKHRHHAQKNPDAPNLRQVHLMHEELFVDLRVAGFDVCAGAIGENITTRGLDILALPTGARLRLGVEARNVRVGSSAERLAASISRPQNPNDRTKCCDAAVFSLGPLATECGAAKRSVSSGPC
jgi:hypothetical protein